MKGNLRVQLSAIEKSLYIALALIVAFSYFGFAYTAQAAGATQISGIGYLPASGECEEIDADFALNLTGDLEGCLYIYIESARCTPSGVYHESGREIFVGNGSSGNDGTFETTYKFKAKYTDCANLSGQLWGGCHHPIVSGSGTGDYTGVKGRFDIKDDLVAGNYPYTGHLLFK